LRRQTVTANASEIPAYGKSKSQRFYRFPSLPILLHILGALPPELLLGDESGAALTCNPKHLQTEQQTQAMEFHANFHADALARPAGLEPATYGSGGRRSIRLSYGRVFGAGLVYQNGLASLRARSGNQQSFQSHAALAVMSRISHNLGIYFPLPAAVERRVCEVKA
jgi:hypothetical protein